MFVLKTIMTFGLVLHLGGPLDAAMVLLGFQEAPAQAVRCADDPALCQMEVASLSIASSQWSVSPGSGVLAENSGLRLSGADTAPNLVRSIHGAVKGQVIARHVGLGASPRRTRVSNEDM